MLPVSCHVFTCMVEKNLKDTSKPFNYLKKCASVHEDVPLHQGCMWYKR